MSDEEVQTKAPAKRGRKPNPEKAAAKKEPVKSVKNGDSEDAPPVKRGRGRPKAAAKKATTAKANGAAPKGRRGRSKKEKKEDSSAEEENGKSSANEEDEDDE